MISRREVCTSPIMFHDSVEEHAVQERIKIFTDITGTNPAVIESHLEDEINDWLSRTSGEILAVTQSEARDANRSHLTIAITYRPEG